VQVEVEKGDGGETVWMTAVCLYLVLSGRRKNKILLNAFSKSITMCVKDCGLHSQKSQRLWPA